MNFVLAERYGLKILIIENRSTGENWALYAHMYTWGFIDSRPSFAELDGMKLKVIPSKEAIETLKKFALDSVMGHRVSKFLEQYEALPF